MEEREQAVRAAFADNRGPSAVLMVPALAMGLIIPEFSAYKATRLSDIVCRRTVRLYGDRVQTVHPQNGDLQGESTSGGRVGG